MSQVEEITRFVALVKALNHGLVETELDDLVEEALQAVHDFGGTAKINFSVNITKNPEFEDVIELKEIVTHKFPEEPRKKSMMFTDAKNRLLMQRQDQEQLDFAQSEGQITSPSINPVTPIKKGLEKA